MTNRLLYLMLPLALIACSPEGDDSGDTQNGSNEPMTINDSNKTMLVDTALDNFAGDGGYDDPFSSFSGLVFDGSSKSRSLAERATETVNCDSGSASVTTNGANVGSGSEPADGNASFSANYDNCRFSSSANGSTFSMTIDGSMSANLEWTGYDDVNNTFQSFSSSIDVNNFSFTTNSNGSEFSFFMDFETSVSKPSGSDTVTYQYDGKFGVGGEGYVEIETITPITVDLGLNRPTSGEIVMKGGDNSSVRYTVVDDGVDVSINGGTATLHTWSEINS